METREMTRVEHRAAADAVEIGDFDRRVGVVDRIVGIAPTTVGADVEIVELARLPIASGARIFGRLHPVALLETENVHLCLGQAPGDGRAGGTGADDQDANGGSHAKQPRLRCAVRKGGLALHNENCGIKSSNPLLSSAESNELLHRNYGTKTTVSGRAAPHRTASRSRGAFGKALRHEPSLGSSAKSSCSLVAGRTLPTRPRLGREGLGSAQLSHAQLLVERVLIVQMRSPLSKRRSRVYRSPGKSHRPLPNVEKLPVWSAMPIKCGL